MKRISKKEKLNNMYMMFLILFFLLFIFGMFVLNILSKDKDFLEQENRKLNTKPAFSANNLLHDGFTSKYEKYIDDQFVLRNFFINMKSNSERAMGKKENNDVYLGADKYLIDKFKEPSKKDFDERLKAVNAFSSKNKNLSNYIMLVPNKAKVLENKLPAFAPVDNQLECVNKFYSGLEKSMKKVDVSHALIQNKDKYLYYKTDHHWTMEGAYLAYLKFCSTAKIEPRKSSDYNVMQVSNDFRGTLRSRSGMKNAAADTIKVYLPKNREAISVNYVEENKMSAGLYDSASLDSKYKYRVFMGGNHSIVNINTQVPGNKKLLVIKDSYANCFIPFLTSHYSSITVVDLRHYTGDINALIKKYDITDVLILYNVSAFFEDSQMLNMGACQ